ncbi:hypothetical protein Tco_1514408 [Tanacetum coccineum]
MFVISFSRAHYDGDVFKSRNGGVLAGSAWSYVAPRTAPKAKELASHMISKGASPIGKASELERVNFIS